MTQPWATLLALGEKRLETRTWPTLHRGPIAIHAAKKMPDWAIAFTQVEPFLSVLWPAGFHAPWDYPLGYVLAVANLTACLRIGRAAGSETVVTLDGRTGDPRLTDRELAFGDFSDGRYAWVLEDVVPFQRPIPATGALQLWEWTRPRPGEVPR